MWNSWGGEYTLELYLTECTAFHRCCWHRMSNVSHLHMQLHAPPVQGFNRVTGLGSARCSHAFKTLAVQSWNHPIVLLLNRSTALSASGGHGHNFNHKPDLTNPFVVLKCGACVPHILLIPGSSEKDHDFWDGVARGKVAPGTCWKWQLKKADWSTGITLTVNVEDSEDTLSHHCVKGVCLFCDISL